MMPAPSFDPDFASAADWAAFYRSCGMQVVPAHDPEPLVQWKRPRLAGWREFQEKLVPDATFQRWYGHGGEHAQRLQMGLITGRASENKIVVDLDVHKHKQAGLWWEGGKTVHNFGIEPETWEQRTGGGGLQKIFRAPAGWHAPTNKTPIGVDIRGQGGFAMLPPSMHESGNAYAWCEGKAPWEIEIAEAPGWLLGEIEELVERYGGDQGGGSPTHTPDPGNDIDGFGNRVDGREDYMRRVVWAAVVDMRRAGLERSAERSAERLVETYAVYERNVRTRLPDNDAAGLEREGRGITAFREKWRRALEKWDTQVAVAARDPKPGAKWPPESIDPAQVTGPGGSLILTAGQFVAGFTPPEYLIDGMVQRGYLYSLTARTGAGKTAVMMYGAQGIARGQPVHGRRVTPGGVLFLAGENPDDIRARYLVLADRHKFRPDEIPVHFVAGVIDIAASMERIRAEAAAIQNLRLVVVDTAAAYFKGDDSNSNAQQGAYARLLRQMTFLPGLPTVIVNCHPVKNAGRDNLVPLGGSAFLNEVDGNLTLWANAEGLTTLSWQGKFRGPEFEPQAFRIETATCDAVKDAAGRLMPSVLALPVGDIEVAAVEAKGHDDLFQVLALIARQPKASVANIAISFDWISSKGQPQKSKVARLLQRLREDKLIETKLGKNRLTAAGKRELEGTENDA